MADLAASASARSGGSPMILPGAGDLPGARSRLLEWQPCLGRHPVNKGRKFVMGKINWLWVIFILVLIVAVGHLIFSMFMAP